MRRLPLPLLALQLLAGCSDLAEYRATESHPFTGKVIGDSMASFIRRGFEPDTVAALTFDPASVASPSGPGVVTTTDSAGVHVLDATPIRPIAPLAHDALSQYDFPGGVRLRSYIFIARPSHASSPLLGREAVVFLSLMDGDSIEMRVVAGTGDEAAGDYFGVFRLTK